MLEANAPYLISLDPDSPWLPAPVSPTLSKDEIHVWRGHLDGAQSRAESLRGTLAPDEMERADRFRFLEDRDRFIVARGLLRAILGRYLNASPEQLQLCHGPCGKPALAAQSGAEKIHFNVSHSNDLALYAIARERRVGIDVEYVRPIPEASQIVERFFSAREKAVFRAVSPDKQVEAFFRCWTHKEAYVKAQGQGLTLTLDRFDVPVAPGGPANLPHVDGDLNEASRWSLYELSPAPGYAAALAAEGCGWGLSRWQWAGCDVEEAVCGTRTASASG